VTLSGTRAKDRQRSHAYGRIPRHPDAALPQVGWETDYVPLDTREIDHRIALAAGLVDSPGVYGVLVGSGMSKSAGILTGWGVVEDLVTRTAHQEGVDLELRGVKPRDWWEECGYGELGYSVLVEKLAKGELAQRALLRRYFEPGPANRFAPTPAHISLAQLVADGRVRVVVTTNFDPLIERAIETAGMSPQVISSANQVIGMTPLCHSPITVIKASGDYASPGLKNTRPDLEKLAPRMRRLLDQVFDEYGLLVVGWSAEYDVALREAIERRSSRRYPMYWATFHGSLTEEATRLIAQQGAIRIDTAGADEFLPDLVQRVELMARRVKRRRGRRWMLGQTSHPNQSVAQQGWRAIPLLWVRVVTMITPAGADDVGHFEIEDRSAIAMVLDASIFSRHLWEMSERPGCEPISALSEVDPSPSVALTRWKLSLPGVRQSSDRAVFRLGGDATQGISALVEILLPRSGDTVKVTLDIGISIQGKVWFETVAQLFRDGLELAAAQIPMALDRVLPPEAEPTTVELHVVASPMNEKGANRDNTLAGRVAFDNVRSLRFQEPDPQGQLGIATTIDGALSQTEAGELIADAMKQMALDAGFMDPSRAIKRIRDVLDLPDNPSDS